MIGILDFGMGNIRSVSNAVSITGYDPLVVTEASELAEASHLILPGVGQFSTAMRRLEISGLDAAVREFADSQRPVLGVCLGMQLLADSGTEGGGQCGGLGLIGGKVVAFPRASGLRIPHVGWNSVSIVREHPVLNGIKEERDFYFVHSYVFATASNTAVLGLTEYGSTFVSAIGQGNVIGFQFHPEKSQANGLRLIEQFCGWDGRC